MRGRRISGEKNWPRRFTGPPQSSSEISGNSGIARFRQISEISDHGVRVGRQHRGIRSAVSVGSIELEGGGGDLSPKGAGTRPDDLMGPPQGFSEFPEISEISRFRQMPEISDRGV